MRDPILDPIRAPIRDPVRDPVRNPARDPARDPIRSDPIFVDAAKKHTCGCITSNLFVS